MIIRRTILMRNFRTTVNTWDEMTERYSDCVMMLSGSTINFEGTEENFDKLHDELTEDESNHKVIGIYEWNLPIPYEVANN